MKKRFSAITLACCQDRRHRLAPNEVIGLGYQEGPSIEFDVVGEWRLLALNGPDHMADDVCS
jgi:hypothetical protein